MPDAGKMMVALLIGAVVALGIAGLSAWLRGRSRHRTWRMVGRFVPGFGLVLGSMLAMSWWLRPGWPWDPPLGSEGLLVLGVLPLALLTVLMSGGLRLTLRGKVGLGLIWGVRLLAALAVGPIVVWRLLEQVGEQFATWDGGDAVRWLGLISLGAVLVMIALTVANDRKGNAKRAGGAASVFVLGLATAFLAVCTMLSGSVSAGQLAAVTGGAIAVTWLMVWWSKGRIFYAEAGAVLFVGLWVNGWVLQDMNAAVAWLLIAAIVVPQVFRCVLIHRRWMQRRQVIASLIQIVLCFVLGGAALAATGALIPQDEEAPSGGNYYGQGITLPAATDAVTEKISV